MGDPARSVAEHGAAMWTTSATRLSRCFRTGREGETSESERCLRPCAMYATMRLHLAGQTHSARKRSRAVLGLVILEAAPRPPSRAVLGQGTRPLQYVEGGVQ